MCACMCVCECVCMCAHVCVCVCVSVHVCVHVNRHQLCLVKYSQSIILSTSVVLICSFGSIFGQNMFLS